MNKAVFLDRDGTINIEKDYLYKKEDFEYLDGAIEALKKLSEAGFLLIVITNQSGIARGYYTEAEYKKLDEWMKADLLSKGVSITASYYCPHHPFAKIVEYSAFCKCRKPGTELFWKAQYDFDIDMSRSYAIGDRIRDLSICHEASVKGILLGKNKGEIEGIEVIEEWKDIVERILSQE